MTKSLCELLVFLNKNINKFLFFINKDLYFPIFCCTFAAKIKLRKLRYA